MLRVLLASGDTIESGWIDVHDPDALPSGDWLSLYSSAGDQLLYIDVADIAHNPRAVRAGLNRFLLACAGVNCGPRGT